MLTVDDEESFGANADILVRDIHGPLHVQDLLAKPVSAGLSEFEGGGEHEEINRIIETGEDEEL